MTIYLKEKRFAILYSPYKDFVENEITYEKNKSDDIGGYKNKTKKTTIKIRSFYNITAKYIRLN